MANYYKDKNGVWQMETPRPAAGTNGPRLNPFEDIQRSLPQGWKVYSSGADRMLVVSPSGQQMNVGLQSYEEPGLTGRVWMEQSDSRTQRGVFKPTLYGTYNTGTGGVDWEGETSSQNIANRLKTAEELSRTRRTTLNQEWTRLNTQGSSVHGINPLSKLSSMESASSQRRQALGVDLQIQASRDNGVAYPDEAAAVQEDYARRLNLAATGNPAMQPGVISGQKDPGGYEWSWHGLAAGAYVPDKGGSLIPLALPGARMVNGQVQLTNDPAKILKNPKLSTKGSAAPFRLENGIPVPIRPGVTTDLEKPAYAWSNVLDENDMPFAGKRMATVFDIHPVPGAGTLYEDPNNMKVGEDYWGNQSSRNVPIKGVSINDLLSGKTSVELDKGLLGRSYGGGIDVSRLGYLKREGENPEPIKGRFGPSTFHASSSSFVIPKYMNKLTGEGVEPSEDFLQGKPTDIVSTDSIIGDLQKRLGMPIIQQEGTGMGLRLAGSVEAAVAVKGFDTKAGPYGVGRGQTISVGGQEVPVTFHTAELKGPAMALTALGEKSPKQLEGIFRDYAARTMNRKQAREFMGFYRNTYGGNANRETGMGISLSTLAKEYARIRGTEATPGLAFASDIYSTVFDSVKPGSARDIRNLAKYGDVATGEGQSLYQGVWHPGQYQWLQNQWSRAYKIQNKNATDEQAQAAFNDRFVSTPQKNGYIGLAMRTSAGGRLANVIQPLTQEWVHGSGVGQEFQMAATSQYPEFARQMGIDVESLVAQGPVQRSKLGLAKYAAFQGQRREQYAGRGDMMMPTAVTRISPELLSTIGAYLGGAGKDVSALDKLTHIANNILGDVPEDNVLYSEESRTFMPNPKAVLGTTFKELGVESGAVAKVVNQAFAGLAEATSPDSGMSPNQVYRAGMETTSGLYNYLTDIIGGKGDFLKGMLSRNVNASSGGNYAFDPTVAPNQVWLGRGLLEKTVRQMGWMGRGITNAVNTIMNTRGVQAITARWPIPAEEGVQAQELQSREERIGAMGLNAYRAVENNPLLQNRAGMSGVQAQANIGDFDYDKFLSILGIKRGENNEVEFVHDQAVANNQMTLERAQQLEQRYFADKEFADVVNAPVQQLADMIGAPGKGPKKVVGKALGSGSFFDVGDVARLGFENMAASGIGMGVGYNPRRAMAGIAAAAGYSNEEVGYMLSTVPTEYQGALDKMLKGRFSAGVPSAAVIAKSYFGTNEETGDAYLHLGSSGFGTKRVNRRNPATGEILPEIKSPGLTLNLKGNMGLTTNRNAMLMGTNFLVEQFAKGIVTKKGTFRMSAEQVASRFALPGERGMLAEAMGDDHAQWAQVVQGYYMDKLRQHGLVGGLSKIFQTGEWGAVLTQAGTKAKSSTDIIGGSERVPGAEAAYDMFVDQFGDDFGQNFQASRAYNETARRGRESNLRNMTAAGINMMIQRFPQTSIFGKAARNLAASLNIPFTRQGETQEAPVSEMANEYSEMFQARRFNEARQNGYEGSYADFQALEKRKTEQEVKNSTFARGRSARTRYENSKFQGTFEEFLEAEEKGDMDYRAAAQNAPEIEQNRADDFNRSFNMDSVPEASGAEVANWPAAPGGGGGDQGGGGNNNTTTAAPASPGGGRGRRPRPTRGVSRQELMDTPRKPVPVQMEAQEQSTGVPLWVGYKVRGLAAKLDERNKNGPDFVQSMHETLTGLGYQGELTNKSVRERMTQAFTEDKGRLLGALTPGQIRQGLEFNQLQRDLAWVQRFADVAPGLEPHRQDLERIMAEAGAPTSRVGGGISVASQLKDMGVASGTKPYMLRMAHNLQGGSVFQNLRQMLGERGVLGAEDFGPEQIGTIEKIFAQHPAMKTAMRLAGKLSSDKTTSEIYPEIAQVGQVASAFAKSQGAAALGKTSYAELAAKEVSAVTDAYKKQVEAAQNLVKVQGDASKSTKDITEAQTQASLTNAKFRASLAGMRIGQIQNQIGDIMAGVQPGSVMSSEQQENLDKLTRKMEGYQKQQAKAQGEAAELGEEKWGSAARRMLGGFGLMYLKSIAGFATQGLGYGMEARNAFDQAGAMASYQYTGSANVPYNQNNVLRSNEALYGVNNNPLMAAQAAMAKKPIVRDAWNSISAGLGVWGYTQFAAGQIGGEVGAGLAGAALPLAIAAGGGAMLLDASSRLQDQQGLAYRQATGKMGINDYMALGLMRPEQTGNYRTQESFLRQFHVAAQAGAPVENLMSMQVSPEQGESRKFVGGKWVSVKQDPTKPITQADRFFALEREVASRFENYSDQAKMATTGYLTRAGGSVNSGRLQNIITDYEMGGWAEKAAMGGLQAAGFRSKQIFGKAGADYQYWLTTQGFGESEKAAIAGGQARAGQLQGFDRVSGLGYNGGGSAGFAKLTKFFELLEGMSDTSFGVLQSQMGAYSNMQAAGLRTANLSASQLFQMQSQAATMNPQEAAAAMATANAQNSQAQMRLNMGQQLMNQSYNFGNYSLGNAARSAIMSAPVGQEWAYNRILSMDPMALASAAGRINLGGMAGGQTFNGTTVNANFAAMTDTNLAGQVTGLNWGTTSFNLGNFSGGQMASRIWGNNWQNNSNFNGAAISAGVNGYKLPGAMTMPDGSTVSSIGGQMGMQLYASQLARDQAVSSAGRDLRGWQMDWDFQHQMWGIEDKQRNLSNKNQMWQFGFQERQINQNVREFNENFGLNVYQSRIQRGWTRDDWGYQDQMRNMQWGWKQEDFQEESRFMTGRQRRLAERSMRRETTVHNLEEDQITKKRGQQEELWKLEDERFKLQKRHFDEGVAMQKEQLKHSKEYYLENKKLEDEKIKLQRKHWEEEMMLRKEGIKASQAYANEQHKINVTMAQLSMATELFNGQLRTVKDDGWEPLKQSLIDALPAIKEWADELERIKDTRSSSSYDNPFVSSGSSYTTMPAVVHSTGGINKSVETMTSDFIPMAPKVQSSQPTNIHVYVGNEKLGQFVVDKVSQELRVQ